MSNESAGSYRVPDRLVMYVPDLTEADAQFLAGEALRLARLAAPKRSGDGARNLSAVWGQGWFGVRWADDYMWFQEAGINPFTMRALAGKVIPMWIKDPTGKVREENPKAKTRVREDGVTEVLIFRRAAHIGQKKKVTRPHPDGGTHRVEVPASHPGAPGRIAVRESGRPWTTPGRVGGAIARRNVGVRWRHPGLLKRSFIRQALVTTVEYHNFTPGPIKDNFGRFR